MAELPPVRVQHPHVECRDDVLKGSPCVRGTRVPVRRLWSWHRRGTTIETLLKRYPQLGPAKVLDALSFAYDNEDLMKVDLERENEAVAGSAAGGTARARDDAEQPPKNPRQEKLPF